MDREQYTKSDTRAAWIMLAPFLLFFIIFVLYPVALNFYYSFTDYNLTADTGWVGLKNYLRLPKDKNFMAALENTVVYALVSVVLLTALGFLTAAVLNRKMRGVKWIRMLMIFPYATSMTAVAMIWVMMYDPTNGFLNKMMRMTGLPLQNWLFDPSMALGCLIAVNVWKNIGYCMLIYLAGMQSIPGEIYEAATVEGASDWRKMISITLPMVRPVAFFVFVTTLVESFKTFELVSVTTGGGPLNATTTLVHQIYQRGFAEFKMGYASAISIVLLAVVMIITAFNYRMNQSAE